LANGFKALVLPRQHAPVVVCDVYYPVGSVDEPPGKTGLAHFVEHMLFKGTDRFPKGHIDHLAFVAAGQSNAETSEDCTHYWFAFPRDRWELALAIEADRMRGAQFDPVEVEAERQVIVEERARDLDAPIGRLDQTHLALSYLHHAYRNPVLGWPDDLAAIEASDLRAFYETHYRPDGAVLVVVGDIDPNRALDRVEAHFGAIKPGALTRPKPVLSEPPQVGRRHFTLCEPDSVARGMLGWHTVPRGHPDGPALDVLADVLSVGRRSRLWELLVERGRLTTWVDAAQDGSRWAGQFLIQVESPGAEEASKVEPLIHEVIDALANRGPSDDELSRSRNRLEAAWRWGQEDIGGLAAGLGHVALWDDWRAWQAEHRAALAVTTEDIQRVVRTYIVGHGMTVGWALPLSASGTSASFSTGPAREPNRPRTPRPNSVAAPERPLALAIPGIGSQLADFKPQRSRLDNGLKLICERRPGTGIVALELFVDAGILREAVPGVAHLTGRMLEEGSAARSSEALAGAIEDVGGTMELGSTGASMRVRAEDLPLALEILADVVCRPKLPPENVQWARKRIAAELLAERDDPAFCADLVFRALVYGDHPLGRDARGSVRDIARLTHEDVVAHHSRYFAPDNAFFVAVGDFEPKQLKALVRSYFGDWQPRGRLPARSRRFKGAHRPRIRRVPYTCEQVHIVLGHVGITRKHPDFAALAILDHIFGSGPGFTDRLSRIVRDELGLAYSVGGGITDSADVAPGLFRVYVGTRPDETSRVLAAVLGQIHAMHFGEFSDEEVDYARRYLAGSWVFDYQTVEQRAERLVELERCGLRLDEPIQWPERVARVTAGEVRMAAWQHIQPGRLCRVEYGPIGPKFETQWECA
jgi:zinc protease